MKFQQIVLKKKKNFKTRALNEGKQTYCRKNGNRIHKALKEVCLLDQPYVKDLILVCKNILMYI